VAQNALAGHIMGHMFEAPALMFCLNYI